MQKTALPAKALCDGGTICARPTYGSTRHITKTLLFVKLTIIFLTAAFLQVSAKSISQQVTYSGREVPLDKVFMELEKQTGYAFLYSTKVLTGASPVTIKAKNMSLLEFLEILFRSQSLKYSIESKTINVTFKSKEGETAERRLSIADFLPVKGVVTGPDGKLLAGINVSVKGTRTGTVTDSEGTFSLNASLGNVLIFTGIGFERKEVTLTDNVMLAVTMSLKLNDLDTSVVTVSTGYQKIPKERATGSFVQIDNELFNRSVSTNFIDRLRDVVPGMSFNTYGKSAISIRGQSTIYGNADPLIVIDDFPFEGDLLDINPNDIESITVLKDAAAASIWGARAGNGVIVVVTKKGVVNKSVKVSFNSNISVADKPDLYAVKQLSPADYIEKEKKLFSEGYYSGIYLTGYQPLTPVVELLYKKRDNPSQAGSIDAQIEALKQYDVRRDLDKYFYQKTVNQQYALNFSGGAAKHTYYVSAGLDRNRENVVGNSYQRVTINIANTFRLLHDKLEVSTDLNYIDNNIRNNNNSPGSITDGYSQSSIYPYARLADESGRALALEKDFNSKLINKALADGLLDWTYKPLNELSLSDKGTKRKNTRINTGIKYTILPGLQVSALYQYNTAPSTYENFQSQQSYSTRNLINRFTQVNGTILIRPVPLGGILDMQESSSNSQVFRSQLSFQRAWASRHEISAIGGFEIRESITKNKTYRYYGYDKEFMNNGIVDYINDQLPLYFDNSRKGRIANVDDLGMFTDRYRSYYGNAAYTYLGRYTASASARLDQSNLFGVEANQQGVPLWSAGLSWNVNKERFYQSSMLPFLKLRASYGYNGNVYKSLTAYTTAKYSGVNLYQDPYSTIVSPPNPELRWERVAIINTGIDFALRNSVISGSVEYYHKKGMDLIGDTPFPPSSGITLFRGNTANTTGNGIDISLNTRNLNGKLAWQTDVVFSFLREKVTSYAVTQKTTGAYGYISGLVSLPSPLIGMLLYYLYSYGWAGLDPQTGDPRGYINKEVSKDYVNIISKTTPENMVRSGQLRPSIWGSVRNTFTYQQLSLSFNISYRMGHYFRKNALYYGNSYGLLGNHADYSLRWQKPGDEQHTIVPSVPSVANSNRDIFNGYSSALISKADNIRFTDIRLNYTLAGISKLSLPFKSAQLYLYSSNLGILWKATHFDTDPENQFSNSPFNFAAGIKIDFN